MKIIFTILSTLTLTLLAGCAKSSNQKVESTQLRAYRLIDDNRTDDAISLLSAEIETKDNNSINGLDESKEATDLRVTLASAYAKKSGISIHEIAHAFEMGKQISSFNAQSSQISSEKVEPNENDRKLKDIASLLASQLKVIQTIAIIPKVQNEKLNYLAQAVRILNNTPNLGPADLIYSALLKIILVRTMLDSDEFKSILPKVVKENHQCVAKLNDFRDHLTRASQILLSGYEDLGKAMPEKKEEVMNSSKTIVDLTASVASINAAGIVLYSLSNSSSFDSIYTALGIGSHIVNCEPDVPSKN